MVSPVTSLLLFFTLGLANRPVAAAQAGDAVRSPAEEPPLYLLLIWHQHQPLYLDAQTDVLRGPWVRTHGTKDYYDMAAALSDHPTIHVTINLTSSLLTQLCRYYLARLAPFLDRSRNRIDAEAFLKKWQGRTDPWVDLLLTPSGSCSPEQRAQVKGDGWSCFSIARTALDRFPDLRALRSKGIGAFSAKDILHAKLLFALANFDPAFLRGPVRLVTGEVVDCSDLIREEPPGTFRLRRTVTDDDANRIVAESVKILEAILPAHRALRYDPASGRGQIEVVTTPFYHPILPLLVDTDLARFGQPEDPRPPRFRHPEDARAHVLKSVRLFEEIFEARPTGMWPAEGSVAQEVVPIFAAAGIRWIATGDAVLAASKPSGLPISAAYRAGTPQAGQVAVFFRDTALSDRIGFTYQTMKPRDAVGDFVTRARAHARPHGGGVLTVILDGENAWEHYRHDPDGKDFIRLLYTRLAALQAEGKLLTVTPIEYLRGNPKRKVPPHRLESLTAVTHLHAGSWIFGTLSTWIGEREENRAWELLKQVREDLAATGLPPPDPLAPRPAAGTTARAAWEAWESIYAAEGSDWFWWYGSDQSSGNDDLFDAAYVRHLRNVYHCAKRAGATIRPRSIEPIIGPATSSGTKTAVTFMCDARAIRVPAAIYIAGSDPVLGSWKPNTVRMYDDGTHGDLVKNDGIWSIRVQLPEQADIEYKYTNSGKPGAWVESEEFPAANRRVRVREGLVVEDRFGKR